MDLNLTKAREEETMTDEKPNPRDYPFNYEVFFVVADPEMLNCDNFR